MPEFIARILAGILGEALVTAVLAVVDRLCQALPLSVRTLFGLLGYALLVSIYVVVLVICVVALFQAETLWLRAGAVLLGAYCSYEMVMLVRKVMS